jgi:two-component system phosphate regulon response regulator PhoB
MNETRAPISGVALPEWTSRILIVEDDTALSLLLADHFEAEGFLVERLERGDEAESRIQRFAPDLVILDWNLPGLSGLEICCRLRAGEATRDLPVIMLTGRGEKVDRVNGLSVADDYVVKPFFFRELIARARALLRRAQPTQATVKLISGDLELDEQTHRVRFAGRLLDLRPAEYHLLKYLMENPGQVFDRSHLLGAVWGRSTKIGLRTVDAQIQRLRKSMSCDSKNSPIRTVAGSGYTLDESFSAENKHER